MVDEKDYYDVLGVDPESTQEEIRREFRKKAKDFHPDPLFGIPEAVKKLAEDKFKEINEAHQVLGDPQRRKLYDEERQRILTPPRPEIEPPSIRFSNVEPGKTQTASFVIRNEGGTYEKIWITNPSDSWVRITGYASLSDSDELPMRVDIEATGEDWGSTYTEDIEISFDDAKTTVRIELITEVEAIQGADYTPQAASATVPISNRAMFSVGFASAILTGIFLLPLSFFGGVNIIFWMIGLVVFAAFSGTIATDLRVSSGTTRKAIVTAASLPIFLVGGYGLGAQFGSMAYHSEFGVIEIFIVTFFGIGLGAPIGLILDFVIERIVALIFP